ncbi:MAG: protein kinase [Polyangiaceae bacterium]|nr:protein kinase [Polyangiaceae bacterium]
MVHLPPIDAGTIVNGRYEVKERIGKGGMGEVFLAYDQSTQQPRALKVIPEHSRMPGDDEALRTEVHLAQQARHPNVCHVYDLAPSPWGPIVVMEYVRGQTLHSYIRQRRKAGGLTADEFRNIATDLCSGLAAIHKQDLVHGDLKPGNVMVTEDRAVILDFGFAQERARAAARTPSAPPHGGTPHYMSPERLRDGGASPEDDVYAMALTLWEMWTCRVPEPGYKPRARSMRSQIMIDVPAELTTDEIRQIFRGLNESPRMRPQARQIRFFSPPHNTTSPIHMPREKLEAGPRPGRAAEAHFTPGAQALLVTYATNAPEIVGTLIPLNRPTLTLGRGDQDVRLAEATVSSRHAVLRWQGGAWLVEDLDSTNGTYADYPFDRQRHVSLMHGGEVQVGECRVKLVAFGADSPHYAKARRYLAKRDGLTGLLNREHLMEAIDEDGLFADWAEVPMHIGTFELRGPSHHSGGRPTILELLALRKAVRLVLETAEAQLLSLTPAVAGRTGLLRFSLSIVGVNYAEARHVMDQAKALVQEAMPRTLEVESSVMKHEPGRAARTLVGW